ncbi:hypothetical protein NECAME_15017 [Necator americanus]|uniref:Uncharacterized protein n=1 Tax=Necator americanus TaxID=51031 RepID=W2SMH5_NECAM|nr:hypothetical protein NECAME_15017 [Necator americanus]ETN69917.1 hypothetical protein NECAME_15017 [Necator americanus]
MDLEGNTMNETNIPNVEIPAPPLKKRGRPPKRDQESLNGENAIDASHAPKKRGRKSNAELAAIAASREMLSDGASPPLSPSSEKRSRPSAYSGKRGRGRPPKAHKSTEKEKENGHEKTSNSSSETSHRNESSIVMTEKRRRGRPRKSEKVEEVGKWSDVSVAHTGKFTLPLPVPESWPLVTNMEEIMTELSEMYNNVKDEKRGEFHNQIKAFVFALHWEDGSFSTS